MRSAPSATRKPSLGRRTPLQEVLRYPILLFTYLVLVPVIKLLDWSGLIPFLASKVNMERIRDSTFKEPWRGYLPRSSDVVVGSFLKSGTNWTMHIAHQVAHRGRGEFRHFHEVVPWPDELRKGYAIDVFDESPQRDSPTGLRVIKTHADFSRIPYTSDARYILVVRDPKDVFVSSYHFMRGAAAGPLMPSVSSWYELFLSPSFPPGFWPNHAHSYWAARTRDNVLFLTYKEMIKDLEKTVRRVAEFMNVTLTPDELQRVTDKCRFESMAKEREKFDPGLPTPWSIPGTKMMRRGKQGGSGEMLSIEQQRRIDDTFKAALLEIGSDFEWDRACSPVSLEEPSGTLQ